MLDGYDNTEENLAMPIFSAQGLSLRPARLRFYECPACYRIVFSPVSWREHMTEAHAEMMA